MSDEHVTNPEEIEQLRAEVSELKAQVAERPARPPVNWGRRILSFVLVLVACLLAPLSVVSVWAKGEVTDTERYVSTVAPLASNPDVQAAVTTRLTNTIFEYIDITALTTEAVDTISANRNLTPRQEAALTALAGPLKSGIQSFTEDKIGDIVRSDAFATAWAQANYVAHQQLVAALSGEDNGAITVANNQVTLNLGDVISQVKQTLVNDGFTVAEKIPAVNAEFVLFQSDKIGRAQAAYSLLNTLGYWLPIIVLVIAAAGVFAANNRRRAFIGLGLGVAVTMSLLAFGLAAGRTIYLADLPATASRPAAAAVFDAFTGYLKDGLRAAGLAGLIVAIAAAMAGPSRFSVGARTLVIRAAAACQRGLTDVGLNMAAVRQWVAGRASALRIVVTAAAALIVILQRYKTPELILWTTVGLLVALFIIEILAADPDQPKAQTTA